ncbi:MAG TPA: rhomboid family intramembrane serine protease [Saprospiraceae bacterium]|nr:rhomboid family intramembrane serine protease [Saprospiraceae bacterium]
MYNTVWNDVKRAYHSNMISKIIVLNGLIFATLGIINLTGILTHSQYILSVYKEITDFLSVSENILVDIRKPWSFITYMFIHLDVFHLLWNMLMFYWFGRILGDFIGDHRVLPIYILGGLAGAFAVVLTGLFIKIPILQNILVAGSTASVMAFAMAAATLSPDYMMRLILIGEVKLKYIVLVLIVLDMARIINLENVGGYIAHLGGIAFGFLYISMLRNGRDLTYPLQVFFNKIKKPISDFSLPARSAVKKRVLHGQSAGYEYLESEPDKIEHLSFDERLDHILDKIKQKGYQNLNEDDKEFLQEASRKK